MESGSPNAEFIQPPTRKRGRPPKEKQTLRTADVHLYFTPGELEQIDDEAQAQGLGRADYAREMLIGDRALLARRQPLPAETARQFALLREAVDQQKQLLRSINRVELDADVDTLARQGLTELLGLFSQCHAYVNEQIDQQSAWASLRQSQQLLEQTMTLLVGEVPILQQIGQVQQKQLLHWQLLEQVLEKGKVSMGSIR